MVVWVRSQKLVRSRVVSFGEPSVGEDEMQADGGFVDGCCPLLFWVSDLETEGQARQGPKSDLARSLGAW